MTDWTLDVTRLDAIVPPEGLPAEPGYEDQDPVTSHGFPPPSDEERAAFKLGELRAVQELMGRPDAQMDELIDTLAARNIYSRGDFLRWEREAADRAVAALTPLVEAAVAWRHGDYEALDGRTANQLADAVDAYRAATPEPQPPAEVSGTPCEPEGGR